MRLFYAVVIASVFAAWFVALLLAAPKTRRAVTWAAIAFSVACSQGAVNLVFASRRQTIAGAESAQSVVGVRLSQFLTVCLVATAAMALCRRNDDSRRMGPILFAVWALAAVTVASGALAARPVFAKNLLVFAMVLSAVVVAVRDADQLTQWARRATRIFTSVSLASAALVPSWAFIGAGDAPYGFQGYDRLLYGLPRLTGLAPHPGALAMIATIGLLLEIGSRHRSEPATERRALACRLAGVVSSATCVVLTQSRTGWAAATIGLLLLAYFRSHGFRTVFIVTFMIGGIVLVARPETLFSATLEGESRNVSTVSGRTPLWSYAMDTYRDHPVIGYGPGFLSTSERQMLPPRLKYVHAHNQIFQTLAEAGTLGTFALLGLIATSFEAAWRVRWRDKGLGMALVVALMLFGLTDVPLRTVGVVIVPALTVLSYLCVVRVRRSSPPPGSEPRRSGQTGARHAREAASLRR